MPASFNAEPGVHYVTFAAVKFVGYSAYCWWLVRLYRSRRSVPLVGLTRTALGMAFGALYALLVTRVPYGMLDGPDPLAYLGLLPVRLVEWALLVSLFFDRRLEQRRPLAWALLGGVGVSYLLDLPAVFGFFITGGISIC
jgi:hypothetical protein